MGRLSFVGLIGVWSIVALGAAGCGSKSSPATPTCIRASDCKDPLICVEGYCVDQCTTSRDCMNGQERCIVTSGGHTCEPPETTTCHFNSECTSPLVCSGDGQCRNQCEADRDCASGQRCTTVTKLCADPTLDKDYNAATNEFSFADGGASDAGKRASDGGTDAAKQPNDGATEMPGASDGGDAAAVNLCADAGTGLERFLPSNFPATLTIPSTLADYEQTVDATFDTDALTLTGPADGGVDGGALPVKTAVATMSDGSEAAVVFFGSYTLDSGATLTITGTRPLILAANDTISIGGTVTTAESPTNHWSAGGPPGPGTPDRGGVSGDDAAPGGGGAGSLDQTLMQGSGGGAYCGPGGKGSSLPVDGGADAGAPDRAAGGQTFGNASLVPLLGGSSGGSADGFSFDNHGGGAVELVAGTSLLVDLNGVIDMPGGGFAGNTNALGAGSGGAILIEAPSITVRGVLAANGGAGSVLAGGFGGPGMPNDQPTTEQRGQAGAGSAAAALAGHDATTAGNATAGGGGGAGRIRLNTGCGGTLKINTSAIISPSVGTTCATTGALGVK